MWSGILPLWIQKSNCYIQCFWEQKHQNTDEKRTGGIWQAWWWKDALISTVIVRDPGQIFGVLHLKGQLKQSLNPFKVPQIHPNWDQVVLTGGCICRWNFVAWARTGWPGSSPGSSLICHSSKWIHMSQQLSYGSFVSLFCTAEVLTFMRLEMLTCALDANTTAEEMEVALGRVWAATKKCPGTAGALHSPDIVISVINNIKKCLRLGSARS